MIVSRPKNRPPLYPMMINVCNIDPSSDPCEAMAQLARKIGSFERQLGRDPLDAYVDIVDAFRIGCHRPKVEPVDAFVGMSVVDAIRAVLDRLNVDLGDVPTVVRVGRAFYKAACEAVGGQWG